MHRVIERVVNGFMWWASRHPCSHLVQMVNHSWFRVGATEKLSPYHLVIFAQREWQ